MQIDILYSLYNTEAAQATITHCTHFNKKNTNSLLQLL